MKRVKQKRLQDEIDFLWAMDMDTNQYSSTEYSSQGEKPTEGGVGSEAGPDDLKTALQQSYQKVQQDALQRYLFINVCSDLQRGCVGQIQFTNI